MTEKDYWPQICAVWEQRVASFKLKPGTQGYKRQQEAYLQGVLTALTTANLMTHDRAHQIAFMVLVGRADEVLKQRA
jgi:hypothetical protein